MAETENWNPKEIQDEFKKLNHDLSVEISIRDDATYEPLNNGPDNESSAVHYRLELDNLRVEVFRPISHEGSLIRITEETIKNHEIGLVTPQGETTAIDKVNTTSVYHLFPDGRWSMSQQSKSTLVPEEIMSGERDNPPAESEIFRVFRLNPTRDALYRNGIRRTRSIANMLIEGNKNEKL